MKKSILIFALLLLSSCGLTIELYKVDGLVSHPPPPEILVLKAIASLFNKKSGLCYLTLKNGEKCVGRWSLIDGIHSTFRNSNLLAQHGYTMGFSPRGNQIRDFAILVGSKGTIMEIEFITNNKNRHGYGIAKDSNGTV